MWPLTVNWRVRAASKKYGRSATEIFPWSESERHYQVTVPIGKPEIRIVGELLVYTSQKFAARGHVWFTCRDRLRNRREREMRALEKSSLSGTSQLHPFEKARSCLFECAFSVRTRDPNREQADGRHQGQHEYGQDRPHANLVLYGDSFLPLPAFIAAAGHRERNTSSGWRIFRIAR